MDQHVEEGLIAANRELQNVRTALTLAHGGFGSHTLTPEETFGLLRNLHNAISLVIGSVNRLNGGPAHGAVNRW